MNNPPKICPVCRNLIPPGASLLEDCDVCPNCFRIFAEVEDRLNRRAEKRNPTHERMLENWSKNL